MEDLKTKITLFRSLFRGREDVFATRWEKGNKSGYMPAYFYDPYHYRAYKMNGGTFQNYPDKSYLPLTDEQVARHLNGAQFIGLYPLLPDNTSWFIAADFDEQDWITACKRFMEECDKISVPVYLERSRSGNGGHAWIFFDKPYPAHKSRKIILSLLTTSGIVSSFDKNTSFDRLFPNQDYLSGKGLGNLIALPLHLSSVQNGNNCFMDSVTMEPYVDQWHFLQSIKHVPTEHLERIYSDLSQQRGIENSSTDQLIIKLNNAIQLNRNGVNRVLINFLKEELNFPSTEFIIKKNSGRNTFGTNRYSGS